MRVSVALEQRFTRLADGTVWTQSGFREAFWQRYLEVFAHVQCVARVEDVTRLVGDWHRVDGRAVSICAVPHYIGPVQFVLRMRRVRRAVAEAIHPGDAIVLRVPGTIGDVAWRRLQALAYPFGVEVVGDPHDVFAPGAVRHPLRPYWRWRATRQLRAQCRQACGASYVTARALQARYPTTGPATAASSIELHDDAFVDRPRTWQPGAAPVRLMFIGSLEQYYKGADVLIQALARGVAAGLDLRLTIVGDGRLRTDLERLTAVLGCGDRVEFTGYLSAPGAVQHAIDAADVFVLPSRTEGLPRAMIEAMARGLPCIGSAAGGIPELLPADALVPPGDVGALYAKIRELVADPVRMDRIAALNWEHAKAYRHELLQRRRVQFYRHVREVTAAWMSGCQADAAGVTGAAGAASS